MKNLELIIPKLEEYTYEQKLESDPSTMSYNAGYDVNYEGYDFITGCIDFKKERWLEVYERRQKEKSYFAYIKDCDINGYVGYVNYQYNEKENNYECGVLIEYKYRGKGYAKDALKLLIKKANRNGIDYLYDNFEKDRKNALNLFLSLGFEIVKETKWKKFNKDVDGVIVRIDTSTYNLEDNYECVIATKEQIIKKWDEEIRKHKYRNDWKIYKENSLKNIESRIVYMGILNGKIITEATAIISDKDISMQNKDNLIDSKKAYLSAFRTNKEYENQGYFSTLYKFMESDLKTKGFKSLTLGVEPSEVRNIKIYFNWGFTKYIKTGYETYADGTKAVVNYYEKEL